MNLLNGWKKDLSSPVQVLHRAAHLAQVFQLAHPVRVLTHRVQVQQVLAQAVVH